MGRCNFCGPDTSSFVFLFEIFTLHIEVYFNDNIIKFKGAPKYTENWASGYKYSIFFFLSFLVLTFNF